MIVKVLNHLFRKFMMAYRVVWKFVIWYYLIVDRNRKDKDNKNENKTKEKKANRV